MTAPAFLAHCNGTGEGAPYALCKIEDDLGAGRLVAAKLQPVNTTGTGAHLAVSYEFEDPNAV
jgi:hypothetical protein